MSLQNIAFIFSCFYWFLQKRMLLVSCRVVFIASVTVLLCVIMQERARAFVATIYCIPFWYSFCQCQFLWCTFSMRFGMGTRHFQKLVPRMKLAHSLKFFICHMANIEVLKYVFTRVVTRIKIFDSCRTRAALVLHSRCSCLSLVL